MPRIRLPEGGEVLQEYDAADRLIAETHVDKKGGIHNRTELDYDKAGNLICIIDNQGNKTNIEYDLLTASDLMDSSMPPLLSSITYEQDSTTQL